MKTSLIAFNQISSLKLLNLERRELFDHNAAVCQEGEQPVRC